MSFVPLRSPHSARESDSHYSGREREEEKFNGASTQRLHTAPRAKTAFASTQSLISPRALALTPLETIRTSSQGDRFPPTRFHAHSSADDNTTRDEDGEEVAIMWGRSGQTNPAGLSTQYNVSTRAGQHRARVHTQRPSAREPLRQFEERIATLPVLRDAVASDLSGLQTTSASHTPSPRGGSPSPKPNPFLFQSSATPPSTFTSNASAFGKSLLQRHCGSFLVQSLEEAQHMIGALRMELDLLKKINESLSNPGRKNDGENIITPYTFSEENFQILYLENNKLKELLSNNIQRYDETNLAFIQSKKDLQGQKETNNRIQTELIAMKTQLLQSEQKELNLSFKFDQLHKNCLHLDQAKHHLQNELLSVQKELGELKEEHSLCTGFKKLVEEEQKSLHSEFESVKKELFTSNSRCEILQMTLAGLEGKLLSQLEKEGGYRQELQQGKQEREGRETIIHALQEELSQARIVNIQTEGESTRLQRDLIASNEQLSKVTEELYKLKSSISSSDSHAVTQLQLLKEESVETISHLRTQLSVVQTESLQQAELSVRNLDQLQVEIRELGKDHSIIKEENSILKQQNLELKQQQEELLGSIETLKGQTTQLKQELKAVHEEATTAAASATNTPEKGKKGAGGKHDTSAHAEGEDLDKLMHRLKELEIRCKEAEASGETHRRLNESNLSKLTQAEKALEREGNLRRIQLKSAKEIRKRLESHVSILDLRCGALTKSLTQLGEKGQQVVSKLGAAPPGLTIPAVAHHHMDGSLSDRSNNPSPTPSESSEEQMKELKHTLETEQKAHLKTKKDLKAAQLKIDSLTLQARR